MNWPFVRGFGSFFEQISSSPNGAHFGAPNILFLRGIVLISLIFPIFLFLRKIIGLHSPVYESWMASLNRPYVMGFGSFFEQISDPLDGIRFGEPNRLF